MATAAAAMWLLLGALLVVTTSSDLISKPRQLYLSLLGVCGPDEYPYASHCCRRCPAGQYVREPCSSPHTQGECAACDRGTFTAFPNGLRSCPHCAPCSEDQEVVVECTSTSNRVCQCQTGRYYRHPDSDQFCVPCSLCPPGKVVLQTCNSTADTVCGLPGPVSHRRYHFLVIGGCLFFVTFMAIIYLCVKKTEDSEDETVYHSLRCGDGDGRENLGPERSAPFRSLHENPGAGFPGPRTGDVSLDMVSGTPIFPRTPERRAVWTARSLWQGWGLGPTPSQPPPPPHQAARSVCDSEEE